MKQPELLERKRDRLPGLFLIAKWNPKLGLKYQLIIMIHTDFIN